MSRMTSTMRKGSEFLSRSWVRLLLVQEQAYGRNGARNICSFTMPHDRRSASASLFKVLPASHLASVGTQKARFARLLCSMEPKELLSSVEAHSSDHEAHSGDFSVTKGPKFMSGKPLDFTKIDAKLLPSVILVGRPNVGKSALFNRLIRRREALVYNTPGDHVTRDIREGLAKLGNLRFRVLDSAGLETEATSDSILGRTAGMTANVLSKIQFVVFLVDARMGLHPLDLEVGKWLRKHAPGVRPIIVMNKCESLCDGSGSIADIADEVCALGFGDPIAISAETGLGMTALHDALQPLLEDHMLHVLNGMRMESNDPGTCQDDILGDADESKLPLQLALVGRPNVGKSTMLNTLLQEERVLVGPESGLTRDSIRAQFEFQGRTVYLVQTDIIALPKTSVHLAYIRLIVTEGNLYQMMTFVDTAGWLHRTKQDKGPSSLSIVQSRKNLMRAHVVALVLDAEEIANTRRSMTHAEVVIARRAVDEGRALVVIVNKMDILRRKENSGLFQKVMEAVPTEIQTVIPQVTGIPVVFTSALEGRGRQAVMDQVITAYEKWCLRLSTARLNRWLVKVMSRHSWKDQAAKPKIKYFTQVKARPPTFVAFTSGQTQLSDTDLRFLTRSLKEDFDLGGIPIRIMQRSVPRTCNKTGQSRSTMTKKILSDKRKVAAQ